MERRVDEGKEKRIDGEKIGWTTMKRTDKEIIE